MKRFLSALALLILAPVAASAGPTYCLPSGNTDGLQLSDVTFNGSNADNCFGVLPGDLMPWGDYTPDSLAVLNAIGVFGGGWEESLKWESAGTGNPEVEGYLANYLGFDWTLDSVASTQGPWSLTLSGGGTLPVTTDMAVVLKAGTNWAAYLFDDEVFTSLANSGDFTINFQQANGSTAGLSHMSVYLREGQVVPEPASLLLLGTGLMFAAARLRKRG